jgi:hypothetical protein
LKNRKLLKMEKSQEAICKTEKNGKGGKAILLFAHEIKGLLFLSAQNRERSGTLSISRWVGHNHINREVRHV